ncbi:hypothetical protein C8J57DRAFT_1226233 [Mycena rebaudengoi]|nr:hypothetical protein C8J57DRAFT_1226233 [Mycena rebaudengoi]
MHQRGGSERGRIASVVGGRRDVGGSLGESVGEVKLQEEDTKKELRVKTLETVRNDETMLMPPLPAACLAHIGVFGLGAFAEDESKEHADTEEEERSNEQSQDCHSDTFTLRPQADKLQK